MTLSAARSTIVTLVLWSLVASCGDAGVVTPVIPSPGTLVPGTWYMHRANGDTLPAAISNRFIGVSPEQTLLDSATLVINADGSYEQRYWIRVLITGQLDRSEVVIDYGTFRVDAAGFLFASTVRSRSLTVTVPIPYTVSTSEPMVFFTGAPLTVGTYKLSRP